MNKINQGNAQLMSLVLVLGLAMMAAPRGIEMMAQQQSERIWDVTAGQFNTVQMAARQYISDNLDTLATFLLALAQMTIIKTISSRWSVTPK